MHGFMVLPTYLHVTAGRGTSLNKTLTLAYFRVYYGHFE